MLLAVFLSISGKFRYHNLILKFVESSSVSVVTGLRVGIAIASRPTLWPIHPPSQWVPTDSSLGVKLPGREANHSSTSSAEVKNAWRHVTLTHSSLWRDAKLSTGYVMLWYLVKPRSNYLYFAFNFTFTFSSSVQCNFYFARKSNQLQ
jgi:hypothetical protein